MRSKAPLVLMEQLVMVLVFALAAALCIQAFVLADRRSASCAEQNQAVIAAQSAAEVYKNCRGDGNQAAELYGGHVEQGSWVTYWDQDGRQVNDREDAAFQVQVAPVRTDSEYLGRATLKAVETGGNSQFCYTLQLAWQEVDGHA